MGFWRSAWGAEGEGGVEEELDLRNCGDLDILRMNVTSSIIRKVFLGERIQFLV